ncbi:hypothetical protein I6G82_06720 [Lysinibacillus macroides]|uniref:IraD/Gp25-like domain-containing protein n=1 Tax=Lysinibacillus macroides TaxID=33935 RepID=A0A0N0UX79_9BACI|nr:hypothetical protein [Lysinibacillus macroides]KOY83427.1 hypothetical protein ADM90_09200 [Lysinibacillus macroides]QPR69297.1 hypothetical protein I6G82_06720 [Lysinibacillus macroides]
MTHQVTALNHVNGNATGVEGILQNVAFILSTFALPCPLRNYGMKPFQRLKKINTKRLIECIQRFEPRAIVVEVDYLGDINRGKLEPTVKVIVNEL